VSRSVDSQELHANRTLALRVKERRGILGWSVRELAERSGLPEDSIEAIENGRRKRGATVGELMKLGAALSTGPDRLLPELYHYIPDPAKQAEHEKLLAELMTRLVTARQKREKLYKELEEATRDVDALTNMLDSARQLRFRV
jgi:transcriptional regulator with XRE-family HTH domain